MNRAYLLLAAIVLLCLCGVAQAAITIDTVTVGDPGNAAHTWPMNDDITAPGSVDYTYNIGKYEVTTAQYTAFLNSVAKTDKHGLYNARMDTTVNVYGCNIKRTGIGGTYNYTVADDWADRPVNFVSYWDSCRFANWLGNGQPDGAQDASTTERGAYTLDGYRGQDGRSISRNPGGTWAVTNKDEWYKAAYYKGGGVDSGYWLYPACSNASPGSDILDSSGNNANYLQTDYLIGAPYYRTAVGEFKNSDSPYGTFDQGGNVWEWNEAIALELSIGVAHILCGGAFNRSVTDLQASGSFGIQFPAVKAYDIGFRVVQLVPEASSVITLAGGLAGLLGIRRRRA